MGMSVEVFLCVVTYEMQSIERTRKSSAFGLVARVNSSLRRILVIRQARDANIKGHNLACFYCVSCVFLEIHEIICACGFVFHLPISHARHLSEFASCRRL